MKPPAVKGGYREPALLKTFAAPHKGVYDALYAVPSGSVLAYSLNSRAPTSPGERIVNGSRKERYSAAVAIN